MTFITKDSGKRENLAGGMVRDTTAGKVDYTLMLKGPLFNRWAELLSRGAEKYGKHNWTLALVAEDLKAREVTKERFRESAMRHMMQWMAGDRTEDHAAAVIFNMNGYEAMLQTDATFQALHDKANPVLVIHASTPEREAEIRAKMQEHEIDRKLGPIFEVDELDAEIEEAFKKANPDYPSGVDL